MPPKQKNVRDTFIFADAHVQAMIDAIQAHIVATDIFPRPSVATTPAMLVETCLVKCARDTAAVQPDLSRWVADYQTRYAGSKVKLTHVRLSQAGYEAIDVIGLYLEGRGWGQAEKGRASAGNLRVRRTGGFNYKMVTYVAIGYCWNVVNDAPKRA